MCPKCVEFARGEVCDRRFPVPVGAGRPPRPTRAPPWTVVPLLLITGPANAAKAGAVLERLRAARPRDPLLIVPTAADVEHYQRELAASGFVFGAQVLTFRNLIREMARRAGVRARPLGPVGRDRVVRAAIASVPLRALAGSAAMPGFARAAGDLFAELQRSLVTPARFTSALRAWAEPSRAQYAGELAALYSAYRRRLEELGRPDQEGYAWAVLDALRAEPGRVGRPARLLLRLRRPHADGARRGRDARPPLRDRRLHRAPVRARAGRVRRAAPPPSRSCARSPPSSSTSPSAPSTTPPRRAPRSTTSSATCSSRAPSASRPTARSGCSRPAASARRPSSSAPRCSSSCARGSSRATSPSSCAATPRPPRSSPRCSTGYGIPVSLRPPPPVPAHPARRRRARRGARRAARRPRRRPADLAAHARPPRRPGGRRPAGGARPPPRAAHRGARPARVGGGARRRAAHRARRAGRGRGRGRGRAARGARGRDAGDLDRPAPPPRRGRSGRRTARTPAWPPTCAPPRASCASSPPPTRRCSARRGTSSTRSAAPACASRWAPTRPPACCSPSPLEIRARRFRAVFVCGLQDGELPARPTPNPFLSDDDRRALAVRDRACACRCTRTCSTASARCSTPPSRGPRTRCSCPGARRTRRASRSPRPRSSTTSARCSPTSCGSSAAPACWPT